MSTWNSVGEVIKTTTRILNYLAQERARVTQRLDLKVLEALGCRMLRILPAAK